MLKFHGKLDIMSIMFGYFYNVSIFFNLYSFGELLSMLAPKNIITALILCAGFCQQVLSMDMSEDYGSKRKLSPPPSTREKVLKFDGSRPLDRKGPTASTQDMSDVDESHLCHGPAPLPPRAFTPAGAHPMLPPRTPFERVNPQDVSCAPASDPMRDHLAQYTSNVQAAAHSASERAITPTPSWY
jgi:hypothetical protein